MVFLSKKFRICDRRVMEFVVYAIKLDNIIIKDLL